MLRQPNRKIFVLWIVVFVWFISSGCHTLIEIQAQRPAKILIPLSVKKVFIDSSLIKSENDKLQLKNLVLENLKKKFNDFGRFEVSIGPVGKYDPNKEAVAIIQGEIVSGGEIDTGQFSEVGTCSGSITGLIGTTASASSSKQAVTISNRGLPCVKATVTGKSTEIGAKAGLGFLSYALNIDIDTPKAPLDEVIRIYQYKNLSLFAQTNFSFTILGKQRETVAIRSDAASFSRHIILPHSYRNVNESSWSRFSGFTPIFPLLIRREALAENSKPPFFPRERYKTVIPSQREIPVTERKQILTSLVDKTTKPFIRAISPYKVTMSVEIDTGGNSAAVKLLQQGNFIKVRKLLLDLPEKESADLYNLGLTFEGNALTIEDYEDALRYYSDALDREPETDIYAQAIGRMEFRLMESRKLKKQLQ